MFNTAMQNTSGALSAFTDFQRLANFVRLVSLALLNLKCCVATLPD